MIGIFNGRKRTLGGGDCAVYAQVGVDFRIDKEHSFIEITATVRTRGKTGVEMEAMTAVSVAALTIYDMAKAVEKTMRVQNVRLIRKQGGKSGDVVLEDDA